jgi:hypothetical protein
MNPASQRTLEYFCYTVGIAAVSGWKQLVSLVRIVRLC